MTPWTPGARAAYNRDLAQYGVDITELSDVLEHLGHPRLSQSTPAQRSRAPSILATLDGLRALTTVRQQRATLLKSWSETPLQARSQARRDVGVKQAPSALRLGELSRLVTRAVEITREAARAAQEAA